MTATATAPSHPHPHSTTNQDLLSPHTPPHPATLALRETLRLHPARGITSTHFIQFTFKALLSYRSTPPTHLRLRPIGQSESRPPEKADEISLNQAGLPATVSLSISAPNEPPPASSYPLRSTIYDLRHTPPCREPAPSDLTLPRCYHH
jgi:hypothetical protein